MKAFSIANKRRLVLLAALACVIATTSNTAFAVPKSQVLRSIADGAHTGRCCSIWDESIRVNEPDTLVPVVVTWSTEYQSNAPFLTGLSVNGGPCTFYGPGTIPASAPADDTYASITFQWVLMPGDYGLVKGRNVLKLCGGTVFADTDTIIIGFKTLSARLGK
ncbi:MAG: hypothetical protein LAO56_02970 [Acidobacteriia bacterium]|nr:hypothetical protein [Terriglobia bacterium]